MVHAKLTLFRERKRRRKQKKRVLSVKSWTKKDNILRKISKSKAQQILQLQNLRTPSIRCP